MKAVRMLVVSAMFVALTLGAYAEGQGEASVAGGLPRSKANLLGAGASFVAPLMTAWADDYRDLTKGRVAVNYQSIGSGGGIKGFMENTIMYGASEAFLTDAQMVEVLNKTGGFAYNLPVALGDVVITYNVPGVQTGVVFNGALIADIFMGKITNWNDARIKALNPTITFPNLAISVAHRSDGSGTTNIFTSYLTAVNEEWKTKVGAGTSVNWIVGTGGKGNEGVSGIVVATPGAIGYNSMVYATINKLSYGYVVNKAGKTIEPSFAATSRAAAVTIPRDGRILLVNTDAADGYPIAGFSWALVHQNLDGNKAIKTREEAIELARFLVYIVTQGQKTAEALDFAPLPKAAQDVALGMIRTLTFKGEKIGELVAADVQKSGF